ncbi:hypothetical protein DMJ13_04720 [halophilic archaeon]|nr:hypothetical protein DMJ13_04720 [halophilic archaeon]
MLSTPAVGADDDAECVERFAGNDVDGEYALLVTYDRSPEELLASWRARVDADPAELGIVSVRDADDVPNSIDGTSVVSLTRPVSLGRLQTAIHLFVDGWDDAPTVVCFDSITAVLDYVGRVATFRFLRSLLVRLAETTVDSHFHLDPGAHDERTIATLRPLFDVVVGDLPAPYADDLSPDALAAILESRRRWLAIRYLAEVGDSATVADVAARVAVWESPSGDPSADVRERVRITLHHLHLPELAETDVLSVDGDVVTATVDGDALERYVTLGDAGGSDGDERSPPDAGEVVGPRLTGPDETSGEEVYWTVYGTDRDSIVVSLARALAAVEDCSPTDLRPLQAVVDVGALQRLARREGMSVHATFQYGPYNVVVDGGEIKVFERSR